VTVVDPHRLIEALEAAGWASAGGSPGRYTRMAWPEHSHGREALVVPLNDTFADYEHLLTAVLRELADAARIGAAAQAVLESQARPWLDGRGDDERGQR
jgi:hypothetical protein